MSVDMSLAALQGAVFVRGRQEQSGQQCRASIYLQLELTEAQELSGAAPEWHQKGTATVS